MNKIDRIIQLLESIEEKIVKSDKPKRSSNKKNKEIVGEDGSAREFWESYSFYFKNRWQVDPERNAMINGMISNICKRVPREEITKIAGFYIQQNDAWYLREMHHVRCLVKDCEILLTRMKSKVVMTASKAREAERISDNLNETKKFLEQKRGINE